MPKKPAVRKIKQVASRAKASPRIEANTTSNAVRLPDTGIAVLSNGDGNDIEFSTERPDIAKNRAIERAKKVDLKAEIVSLVNDFRNDIDERLKALSDRIEDQMKPMVRTIADIAVAKKELSGRLNDFAGSLGTALSLNDELEPIDISTIFDGTPVPGEAEEDASSVKVNKYTSADGKTLFMDGDFRDEAKLVTKVTEDEAELLAEVTEEVRNPTGIN